VSIHWRKAARMVLTSGQNDPDADKNSGDPPHSVFANQFIAVLRQNEILMSGDMLAHELASRMAGPGQKATASYANLQDPQHKFGDFYFVPVAPIASVAYVPR
jgi:hypothetical protein